MRDIYQEITNRIIAELKNGNIPWHCSWRPAQWRCRNMVSGREYRGINAILLSTLPYESPFYLTLRQLRKLGGELRPGAAATEVVFWMLFEKDENTRIPLLRFYQIYNLEQTCGIPEKHIPYLPPKYKLEFNPIETAEEIIAGYIDGPEVIHGGDDACYCPLPDRIRMPNRSAFKSEEEYYSTLFHEQTHSTGHRSRLNRPGMDRVEFGSDTYSKEELIAEMGAAFLCAYSGIENTTIRNSGAYIRSWLERLRSDKKLVVQAAQKAQKAADYILKVGQVQEKAA
ncbi:MAG: zincin-like metallopeptidase domain-containing protein [Victivallaceae bacterium]|nr:zincin-like metallopeptidase domain-containing protein [Victivallaceae bacterium]